MSEFAQSGQFVVRLEEPVEGEGYHYSAQEIISMGTLRQIMQEYCEVKVTIIEIQ